MYEQGDDGQIAARTVGAGQLQKTRSVPTVQPQAQFAVSVLPQPSFAEFACAQGGIPSKRAVQRQTPPVDCQPVAQTPGERGEEHGEMPPVRIRVEGGEMGGAEHSRSHIDPDSAPFQLLQKENMSGIDRAVIVEPE